jgi:hypothetical protein
LEEGRCAAQLVPTMPGDAPSHCSMEGSYVSFLSLLLSPSLLEERLNTIYRLESPLSYSRQNCGDKQAIDAGLGVPPIATRDH